MAVLDGELLGLFNLLTSRTERRRGYGKALLGMLVGWGETRGATGAFLQVEETNLAARRLFENAGFRPTYEYW